MKKITEHKKMLFNKIVFESDKFHNACEKVEIKITKRQASKFRRKTGKAYQGLTNSK